MIKTMTVAVVPDDETWSLSAVCRDANQDWFFGDDASSRTLAKKLCADCPVRSECLNYALTHGEQFGVWGGTTQTERWERSHRIHGTPRRAARGCKCSPCKDVRVPETVSA